MESSSLAKIERFSHKADGWRFGTGVATDPAVAERARHMVWIAESFGWDTDVFPGVGGELLVDCERGSQEYEFILNTDGSLTTIKTENDEDPEPADIPDDSIAIAILRSLYPPCDTYDFLTEMIGNPAPIVSKEWHLRQVQHHPEEYQSLIRDALRVRADQPALILPLTTKRGALPSFFGSSRLTTCVLPKILPILQEDEAMNGVIETFTTWDEPLRRSFSNPITAKMDGETIEYAEA